MAETIQRKVTVELLGYYDEKLKQWVVNKIGDIAQVDWNETDELSSSYIKNKPTNLITSASLHFDRNENKISVNVDETEIDSFFAPQEMMDTKKSFIASELKTYFETNSIIPDTYNGAGYNPSLYPISGMTEENGPYLVLISIDENNIEHYHIKTMRENFGNYATKKDLEILKQEIEESQDLIII